MDQRTEAEKLMANRLLPQILDELQKNQIDSWQSAETLERREQLWVMARATETVREYINERAKYFARDGKQD